MTLGQILAANPEISFRYEHRLKGQQFVLDTDEIKTELEDVPINDPEVVTWLRDFMTEGITAVGRIS